MFRFTTRQVEQDLQKQLYDKQSIDVPSSAHLCGEEFLKNTFRKSEAFKELDILREQLASQSQSLNGRSSRVKHFLDDNVGSFYQNKAFGKNDPFDLSRQDNNQGTFIFPKKASTQTYYIIPAAKAGMMELFNKYKDYKPKEDTSFRPNSKRNSQTRPSKCFKALSQHVHQKSAQNVDTVLEIDKHKMNSSFMLPLPEDTTPQAGQVNMYYNPLQENAIEKETPPIANNSNHILKIKDKYKQTHNSCFKGACRDQITTHQLIPFEDYPGPGEYENKSQFKKQHKLPSKDESKEEEVKNFKQMQSKIKKVVRQFGIDTKPLIQRGSLPKTVKPSFVFIQDQRDRFGENQYINYFSSKNPIYCPGPGQYQQTYQTICNKQDKIERIKDQRRFLKEWLNPKKSSLPVHKESAVAPTNQYNPESLCVYQFAYLPDTSKLSSN